MTLAQIFAAIDTDPKASAPGPAGRKYARPIRGPADVETLWARQQARQLGNALGG